MSVSIRLHSTQVNNFIDKEKDKLLLEFEIEFHPIKMVRDGTSFQEKT